ncbi:hypothetical protein [Fodinibius sp. AD559]|uniref:hypothetical protein n=1 Tax=Fodinibius sp. AD559 TaxID=3424179 RepID=UPI004046D95D
MRANPGKPVIDLKIDCSYTVEGTLSVEHHNDMANFLGRDTTALGNVHVRVSARKKLFGGVWGNWAPWGKVRTDSEGHFKLSRSKNCQERQFMVKVHFKEPDLEIRHGMATDKARKVSWYTVYKESSANDGNRDIHKELDDLTFSNSGNHSLSNREPWFHADIWTLYQTAIDTMNSYGSRLGFQDKVKVKYPHRKPNLDPYANPLNNVIYLVKKSGWDTGKDIRTMLHELFHIWAYQHSRMENRMAYYLVGHMKEGTHGMVDQTFVAFHEGLAKWGSEVLQMKISPGKNSLRSPLSRDELANEGIEGLWNADLTEWGWLNLFNLMHKQDVWEYNFGTSNKSLSRTESRNSLKPYIKCDVARLDFEELLNILDRKGTDDMHVNDMSYPPFSNAVQSQNNGVGRWDMVAYANMIDPSESVDEIRRSMCEEKLAKLPSGASDWYGTYTGRNDGREAKLTIKPSSDQYYLDITYEDLDRGTNLTGQADARQIVDGRFKTLKNLTLSGSGDQTKKIQRLFLHSDPNYISGYSEWNGNDYGMAFSKSGVNASADPRDLMNTSKELEQWSEWTGSYKGRQDGRKAKLTITWDNLLWLHIKLEGLERNKTFTGTVRMGDQESTPAHIMTDIELTSKDGDTKKIEQFALHTWNTNYITGHSKWSGNDYGNFYTRTSDIPDTRDDGGFSLGYEKYEEIRKAKQLEKAFEGSHSVANFQDVLDQTGTDECTMTSQNCSGENSFPQSESQLRNSNYGVQPKACVEQINSLFNIAKNSENISQLNSAMDNFGGETASRTGAVSREQVSGQCSFSGGTMTAMSHTSSPTPAQSENIVEVAADIVQTIGNNFADGYQGMPSAWNSYRFIRNSQNLESQNHFQKPVMMALRGYFTVIAQADAESGQQLKKLALDGAAYGGLIGSMHETYQLKTNQDADLFTEKTEADNKIFLIPKGGFSLPGVSSFGDITGLAGSSLQNQTSVFTWGSSLTMGSRDGFANLRLSGLHRSASTVTTLQNDQITTTEVDMSFSALSAEVVLKPLPRIIVQPYAIAGYGARKLSFDGGSGSNIDQSWKQTVPIGAGVDIPLGGEGVVLGVEMVDYISNFSGEGTKRHDAFLFGYIGIPL